MNIIPSEIEKYCKKVGHDIYIEVDPVDRDVVFRIVSGRYEQNGSLAVFLTGQEILEILHLNRVLGADGKVEEILNKPAQKIDEKIHNLIYELLAKYIIQMHSAAMGKDFFPEIMALKQHYTDYFRRQ